MPCPDDLTHRVHTQNTPSPTLQIADSFVFWQAQFTVPEARSFLDRYHHGVEALPLLSVLDPRTGREMWMWSHTGAVIDKSELAAKRACRSTQDTTT